MEGEVRKRTEGGYRVYTLADDDDADDRGAIDGEGERATVAFPEADFFPTACFTCLCGRGGGRVEGVSKTREYQ
jgi:hypothetical protein